MTMLRDIALVEDGFADSTDERVGVSAEEIPAGGNLPAFLLNDIDTGFPDRLYSLQILTLPAQGVLYLNKAGVGTFSGAAIGTHNGTQRIRKYDPDVGLVSDQTAAYKITVDAIMPPAPTVTSVTISPKITTVQGGAAVQYIASAVGTNSPPQTFSWATTLGQISAEGLLIAPAAIAVAQTGEVTAASTLNLNVKDTATFTVPAILIVDPPIDPPVEPPIDTSGAPSIFASTILSDDGIYLSTVLL